MTVKTPPSITAERLEQIRALLNGSDFDTGELYPLAGDASFRRYIRIHKNGKTAMVMDAPPAKEDVRPFLITAQYLHSKGFSAPAILAQDTSAGLLLLEDLGDDSYTRILRAASGQAREALESEIYSAAIDVLAHWHDSAGHFSNPQALAMPLYDEVLLMREIGLFSDWYMPQVLGKDKAAALAGEYKAIWRELITGGPLATNIWVHRDYHADNLMWLPDRSGIRRVGLLDFQDGVYGDAAYDLVSLLEDARRDVPLSLVQKMIERYITVSGTDSVRFKAAYALLGAQRNSKIIGIFSRLAARDHKQHYLDFLPRVWKHLEYDLSHPLLSPLKSWLDKHIPAQDRGAITIRHDAQDLALTA